MVTAQNVSDIAYVFNYTISVQHNIIILCSPAHLHFHPYIILFNFHHITHILEWNNLYLTYNYTYVHTFLAYKFLFNSANLHNILYKENFLFMNCMYIYFPNFDLV